MADLRQEDYQRLTSAQIPLYLMHYFNTGYLSSSGSVSIPEVPEMYTKEGIESLSGMIKAGSLKKLCHDCGWIPQFCLSKEGKFAKHKRIWEAVDLSFDYSHKSIKYIKSLYCNEENLHSSDLVGDQLFHFLIYYGIPRDRAFHFVDSKNLNPLIYLAFPERFDKSQFSKMDEKLVALLPWIGVMIRKSWRQSLSKSLKEHVFKPYSMVFGKVFNEWLFLNKQKPSALSFMLEYFADRKMVKKVQNHFFKATANKKLKERGDMADAACRFLRCAHKLEEIYRQGFNVHPLERSEEDQLFMAEYQRVQFDENLENINQAIQKIRPKVL